MIGWIGKGTENGFFLDENIPMHVGLHHHGEEPNLAGYTLKEIFHYGKSVIPGQQTITLQILKAIARNVYSNIYKELGEYWSCTCISFVEMNNLFG